jgi:hypothetical protein
MVDKLREVSEPIAPSGSGRTATLHAAIGHFSNSDNAQKAVKALRRAGFTADAISVRQLCLRDQDGLKNPAGKSHKTIVGVQAEGERAAEAWSILQNSRT